jgi:hypothetical protein
MKFNHFISWLAEDEGYIWGWLSAAITPGCTQGVHFEALFARLSYHDPAYLSAVTRHPVP